MIKKIVITCVAGLVLVAGIIAVIAAAKKQGKNTDTKPRTTTETDIAEAGSDVKSAASKDDGNSDIEASSDRAASDGASDAVPSDGASSDDTADADAQTGGAEDYWFIDATDKATVRKLIDDLIACEPRLGDIEYKEQKDISSRVRSGFGHEYHTSSYSSVHQFGFEYSKSEDRPDLIQDRDHVSEIGYSGYAFEEEGYFGFNITGYKKTYTHKLRPGSGEIIIIVYDEERAETCAQICKDYIEELYKDEIVAVNDYGGRSFDYNYGEGVNDNIATIRYSQLKDKDDNPTGAWRVDIFLTFNTPDLMPEEI